MAINKIKLQQIDADFSKVVGQYGSGYFATTGSLNSLSVSTVPYSYIATGGFLYNTGAQSISGVKNFFSRPTFSGAGLSTLQEVLTLTGQQTLSGAKIFESGASFNNSEINFLTADVNFIMDDVNFSGSDIHFSGADFTFDTISRYNLANELQQLLVTTDSNQTIDGVKNFTSVPKVNGSNLLISGNPYPVYTFPASISSRCFPLFVEGAGGAFKTPLINEALEYNASSQVLMSKTFSGSAFLGKSLAAPIGSNLEFSTFAQSNFINFQFPSGSTSYKMTNDFFAPSTSGTKALGQPTMPWGAVYATTTTIQTSDRNLKTEISEIPDSWLDAWQEVDYVRYKFKDAVAKKGSSSARWHVGHIAQNIHEKFASRGLDAFNIGMLCYDKWDQSIDGNGNIVPSGEIWSIRPDECQFMEMALMRRSLNRLKSGVLI